MMSLSRSRSTGELVLLHRQQPLALAVALVGSSPAATRRLEPGWQSTNFSPISPCAPILHSASAFQGMKPSSSIRSVTAAFLSGVTSRSEITPTGTPATFTSSPCTSVEALSKIARTK